MSYPQKFDQDSLVINLRSNKVMAHLKQLGYQTINFETGYPNIEVKSADLYLTPPRDYSWTIPYETYLINSTAWRIFKDGWNYIRPNAPPLIDFNPKLNVNQIYVQRQLFVLDQLKNMPAQKSPKFVYAHLMIPHPPFQFDKNGVIGYPVEMNGDLPNDGRTYTQAYTSQIEYINQQMLEILPQLISKSTNEANHYSTRRSWFYRRKLSPAGDFKRLLFPGSENRKSVPVHFSG